MNGKCIAREQDRLGTVAVYDDGNRRFLSFGDEDEQSCILKANPSYPQYPFIRSMLLPLIYVEPKRVLCFGLGAGSLNSAMAAACPGVKQEVVELRQTVVDFAYKYFYLPRSKAMNLVVQDAADYVEEPIGKRFDLIFSDLYDAQGLCATQIDDRFLQACIERLQPKGWLVLNCWQEHRADQVLDLLDKQFEHLFTSTTPDGNWLLFATHQVPALSQKAYKERARLLSDQLGFSLLSFAKRMKPVSR